MSDDASARLSLPYLAAGQLQKHILGAHQGARASRTLNSRHLTGHAVNVAALVGRQVRWDWPLYGRIAEAFKAAARELRVPLAWGGDWTRLRDGPHFELDRKAYP